MALALAGVSIALASAIGPTLQSPPMLVAVAAVALAASLGGAGPGLLTTFIVGCWYGAPRDAALDAPSALRLGLFIAVGTVVAWTSGWSRTRFVGVLARGREAARRVRGRLGFLSAITRAMDEGVYALDRAGRITYLNAAAERMLGFRQSELLGKTLKEGLRCDHVDGGCPGKSCRLLTVMSTGEPSRGSDDVLTRKDGSRFPVRYSSAPVLRNGAITGAVVAFQDITEERCCEARERFLAAATQQLAHSIDYEETLARVGRLALPHLGDWCMVVLIDETGAARRIAVETLDPARADAAREILRRYPIDLQAEHGVGRVLRSGEAELLPEVSGFVGQSGSTFRARAELLHKMGLRSFMAVPLRARGRLIGVMDFAISTTSRRFGRADLALANELARRCALAIDNARLHRQAQDAVRAREDTLAIVSHDLKSPLAAIRTAAGSVKISAAPGPAGEAARRAAESIDRVCGRMNRLIGDLVDLASIDAGRLSMLRAEVSCAETAVEALETIRPVAEHAKVEVGVEARGGGLRVDGDRDRIHQVLVNLLSNAVKVTPAGGRVRLRYRARGRRVVFSVSDTGPGVSREDQSRIFDRYWRGADAGYKGTGLGLSIAKALVEAHGGRLWVVSKPGAGATFRFTLPAAGAV